MKNIRLRNFPFLYIFIASVVLTGCSTLNGGLSGYRQPENPYGDYLSARYASSESDVQMAAKYYASALKKDPENTELRQRTMLSTLFAGRISDAAKQANRILVMDTKDRVAVLIAASDAMAKEEYGRVEYLLQDSELGPLNQVAADIIYAWALQGNGQTDEAISKLSTVSLAPVLGNLALFHQALILTEAGRLDEVEIAYSAAMEAGFLPYRTAYAWSVMRAGRGDRNGARVLVEARLKKNPTEVEANYLLAKLNAGGKIPQPFANARQGAAESLYNHAQILTERSLNDWAIIYLELALHMDANNDAAQTLLARLYQTQGRTGDALVLFSKVAKDSPWYMPAQISSASALLRADRTEEGLARLRELHAKTPTRQIKRSLASALQGDKQYNEALPLLTELIEQDSGADWRLYFSRAVSLERTDRWRLAIPDLRKALELEPKQADVLNYLGYTFVDAGENLDEGFELIRQAIELSPEAGYIVDSLGWGYFRLGRFEEAVTELEKAVKLEPGEPTINDHLGDAYWKVGRKLEAGFQWQRVLSLEPDETVNLAWIKTKIKSGLTKEPDQKLARGD